jgi:protein-S-isoprenylcysteine O-methyltransferase Ste14
MAAVASVFRAALYTVIIAVWCIGVNLVRDTTLFQVFLFAFFVLRVAEYFFSGRDSSKRSLKGEDHSRVTTWIIGASFITNVVVPILQYRYTKPLPEVSEWSWAGLLLFIAGMALRVWSIRVAGEAFKPQIAVTEKQQLATTGPYAWVRHPSYLGLIIAYLGMAAIFSSSWALAALLILVVPAIIVRLLKEEQILAAHFGEEWKRYTAQTHSLLIPGL